MSHPTKKFRPVGKRATKVPRQTFNWMGRVAEKCSNLGVNGYEASDAIAVRPDVDRVFKLVEVMDSWGNLAGVLNYQTSESNAPVAGYYVGDPEFLDLGITTGFNRGHSWSGQGIIPGERITISSYGGEPVHNTDTPLRTGYIFPRKHRLWVVRHQASGQWLPIEPPPMLMFTLKTSLPRLEAAEAWVIEQAPAEWIYGRNPGRYANTAFSFWVYDLYGLESYPVGTTPAPVGSIGWAIWNSGIRAYEVFQISTFARGPLSYAPSSDFWEGFA